ncbi:transcriptional regulator SplA domain-containing protein [Bacillus sp. NPDC077027]|uniref:transcriptional regulator SplA domain-containing protein n=1 Tax=Bacillus sp. NPDC077027 TaxID=3390548 RepID=UPI003D05F428
MSNSDYQLGDKVYVIYRNPHAANVAQIKEAEVVSHPYNEQELALFLLETYHTLAEDDAIFSTYDEAESLYKEMFD